MGKTARIWGFEKQLTRSKDEAIPKEQNIYFLFVPVTVLLSYPFLRLSCFEIPVTVRISQKLFSFLWRAVQD